MSASEYHSLSYRLLRLISRQPLHLGQAIAAVLAGLVNFLSISRTSQSVRLNLQIALPDLDTEQREHITRKAIRNELMAYFEFFSIWGSSTEKNLSRIHHVHGEALFHDALQASRGLVLIVPHFGTWEIMNSWVAQFSEMTILYKPVKDVAADRFVREARSRERAHLVPTDESGVRQIFKALKAGGTTVILPDHTPNSSVDMIDYFGIPLESSSLTAKLIQKTKAKTLLIYAMRNQQQGFDMYIETVDPQIYSVDPQRGTGIIHQAIEQLIRRYPEFYHWSYKRFKANPMLADVYNVVPEYALQKVSQLREARLNEQQHLIIHHTEV